MDRLVRTIAFVPARGFYLRYGKRGLDLAIALPALVVLSPLLLALSFLIRLKLGAPVLFRQERVGLDERVFRLIKLRTMTSARDACGHLLPDADRLTPLGLFLRRWSIDELPQLINVIRGDLSLIGPRPLLVRYLPRYTRQQRRRHEVRPGITGWAQVNGRNLLSWRERFEHDVWYVDNCTFPVDLKILVLTVVTFLGRDTTIASGGKDVDEFWGTAGRPVGAPRCEPAEEADGGAQWTRD